MENKNLFFIPDKNDRSIDYDNGSTHMQMFKDSLENSDSLNVCGNQNQNQNQNQNVNLNNINPNHFAYQYYHGNKTPMREEDSHVEGEELSTEEKTRFSNNLNDLRKSYIVRTTQNQTHLQSDKNSFTNNTNNFNNTINCTFLNEETAKISYKHIPISERESAESKINSINKNKPSDENSYFWFAAYDKLLNVKKVKKIFNFFSDESELNIKRDFNKEQPVILKDFEIYFDTSTSNYTNPFIRQKKDSFVFLKLYYLSLQSFNKIFNYINKSEQQFLIQDFMMTNNIGDTFNFTNNKIKSITGLSGVKSVNPYSLLLCLGSFLNTNIYSFTNTSSVGSTSNQINTGLISNVNNRNNNSNRQIPSPRINSNSNISFPSNEHIKQKTKSIVKIIKYLSDAFTNYSAEFFMYHLYSRSGINALGYTSTPNQAGNKKNSLLQIQLTEIKTQLNKKKLKNLEINKNLAKNTKTEKNEKNIKNEKNMKNEKNPNFIKNMQTIHSSKTVTNNNIKIKNINITTALTSSKNSNNSFRSYQINHNQTKTISSSINPLSITVTANSINSNSIDSDKNVIRRFNSTSGKYTNNNIKLTQNKSLKQIVLIDSNEICNSILSPDPKHLFTENNTTRMDIRSQFNDTTNQTNSKIYVVARDSNIRFKTELEEDVSVESSFEGEVSSDVGTRNGNITMSEECYNTPTKKKVLRYYS